MIVVAIIGILAAIAIPSYQNYTKKAKFTEVIEATSAAKTAVEICAQDQASTTNCTAGSNGVPANVSTAYGNVASVTTSGGTITATAISTNGLSGETYILVPTFTSDGKVTWTHNTGTCFTNTPPIC